MFTRLLRTYQAPFTIRLKGPASQRRLRQQQLVVKPKRIQNFFSDYSPETHNFYRNGFTPAQMANSNQMVKRALSLENATPKQILQYRTEQAIKKYQRHPLDCGNAAIQCALMSEKIILLMKHVKNYPRDKRTGRFLAELIQKRRNMLSYCMRTDYHRYKWVCVDYGIPDEHPRNSHHKECFGNHFNNFRTDR